MENCIRFGKWLLSSERLNFVKCGVGKS
jgi:hypothetical protein